MCELYLELVSVTFECRTKHRAIIRKAETAVGCHTVLLAAGGLWGANGLKATQLKTGAEIFRYVL